MPARPHPYDMIADERKTTLSASGGVVLGYGPGPGLRHANFWNRIGSLYSCYRPAVALLTIFDAADPHTPLALRMLRTDWHPNHCQACYEAVLPAAAGLPAAKLQISEDRYGTKTGLVCRLRFSVGRHSVAASAAGSASQRLASGRQAMHGAPRQAGRTQCASTLILCFHGQVQQSAFFDYMRRSTAEELAQGRPPGFDEPLIDCAIEPALGLITLTQPHPHDGLLKPADGGSSRLVAAVNSIQRVWLGQPLSAGGYCQSESELHTLWHDHGVESSLRLRLGQVGGRFVGGAAVTGRQVENKSEEEGGQKRPPHHPEPLKHSHRAPLYYMTTRLALEPGESQDVVIQTDFHTDDPGGDLRTQAQLDWEAKHGKPYRLTSKAVDRAMAAEEKAWRRYLDSEVPQLECSDKPLERYWYYVWYVLRANRTAPGAHITAPFTAPSKYMYWGPWIWDAYFHVLGERWLKDPGIAKDSIRAVLQMQFPSGFIPVCSGSQYRMCFHEDVPGYRSPTGGGYASYVPGKLRGYKEDAHPFEASFRYMDHAGKYRLGMSHNEKTQTPLITPALGDFNAVWHDVSFVAECLPALKRYDDWLWNRRTDEQSSFILWHGDESGWDDATRHYPVPALPFDVQVHSLLHRSNLNSLNNAGKYTTLLKRRVPGQSPGFEPYVSRLDSTRRTLDSYYDEKDLWHYDLAGGSGTATTVRRQIAASGLFALLIRDMPPDRLEPCIRSLDLPTAFARPYPIPTLAASDAAYRPHGWGWNGPAWLQVNYFTLTGLLLHGHYAGAEKLWCQTRDLVIREGSPHSYELYDPELGTGMGCPDYSWQGMLLNFIIEHMAGLGASSLQPWLPAGMDYLKISNLPGEISSVELQRSRSTVALNFALNRRAWRDTAIHQLNMISTDGLGEVSAVSANGHDYSRQRSGAWFHDWPIGKTKKWEFSIKCQ